MLKIIDAILVLLKFEFLNIFWFWLIVFACVEHAFYLIEKLCKVENIVRWYDLLWLLIVFALAFFTAYRLYIFTINGRV